MDQLSRVKDLSVPEFGSLQAWEARASAAVRAANGDINSGDSKISQLGYNGVPMPYNGDTKEVDAQIKVCCGHNGNLASDHYNSIESAHGDRLLSAFEDCFEDGNQWELNLENIQNSNFQVFRLKVDANHNKDSSQSRVEHYLEVEVEAGVEVEARDGSTEVRAKAKEVAAQVKVCCGHPRNLASDHYNSIESACGDQLFSGFEDYFEDVTMKVTMTHENIVGQGNRISDKVIRGYEVVSIMSIKEDGPRLVNIDVGQVKKPINESSKEVKKLGIEG
ncbi:hypothetical protein Fmac_004934 [Flemingia macrophylla]|uniref:Uncharacterized protein n=1 Tax=Flemingia macrophylla TaxID=520843 RepID=A0ABD1N6H4_9FABA